MLIETTKLVGHNHLNNDDQCMYCKSKLGTEHDPECICIQKAVIVEVKIRFPVTRPNSWDKNSIEFHMNESSWCANNIINDLKSYDNAAEGTCLCGNFEATYIRDATEEDLKWIDSSLLLRD